MNNKPVGVFTTHNEPSTLTDEEKIARKRRRNLGRRIEDSMIRLSKTRSALETAEDPIQRITLEAQAKMLNERISDAETRLAEIIDGVVN